MHLTKVVAAPILASLACSMLVDIKLVGRAVRGIAERQVGVTSQGSGSTRGSTTPNLQTVSTSNSDSSSNSETTRSSSSPSLGTTPISTPRPPQTLQNPQTPQTPQSPATPIAQQPTATDRPSSVSITISANASDTSPISTVRDGDASQPTIPPAPVVSTVFQTITTTNSIGEAMTVTSATLTTSTPVLAGSGQNNSGSGMTTQTRNTVIGVVVGVGGAVVLVGLGLIAWRVWGRKKAEDEHIGMAYKPTNNGYAPVEKNDSVALTGAQTPFQSTLERYHAPNRVNSAANF